MIRRTNDITPNAAANAPRGPRRKTPIAWLAPVFLLAPLALAPKGCDSAVVGNECPDGTRSPRCAGEGETCGGLLGTQCATDQFCKIAIDGQCGAADQTGVCTAIPDACDARFDPVCGCDDRTYGNECEADLAGVSVVSRGECPGNGAGGSGGGGGGSGGSSGSGNGGSGGDATVCGGLLGGMCARGEYCNFPPDALCGRADATGVCEEIPSVCTREFNPVCGCDGVTYSNPCTAAAAGVSVEHAGACAADPGGGDCGGLLGLSCVRGEYCNFPPDAMCGAADQTGVCTPIPQACDTLFDPVCGCDDRTYGNACEAAGAGVSVAARGECAGPGGTVCGGLRGAMCARGEYCNFPPDAICGRADATGVCAPIPTGCTRESNPVCGCDGVTYGNPCMAAAAGVSVERRGACETTDPGGSACGGLRGLTCVRGEFCNYPLEAMCGAADQTGICTPIPGACTTELNPVCGCDDRTYSNPCAAALAGISVAARGACR